jgi:hypothetical protein
VDDQSSKSISYPTRSSKFARTFPVAVRKKQQGNIMRRFLAATLVAIALTSNVGCILPIYDADPAVRARQLLYTSEDLRALREEWHRFWFLDMPDHMTPMRTHGGIL